jgi:serine/threonine-protein kinase
LWLLVILKPNSLKQNKTENITEEKYVSNYRIELMISEDRQECSQCRHLNSSDSVICVLCGWSLAQEGMTLTYHPDITPSSNGEMTENVASQNSPHIDDRRFSDVTIAPDVDSANIKSKMAKVDGMAHFKINKVLGQGGMGAVYRAEDITLQRFVALKLFRSQLLATIGNGQHLLDEARMACKLNHPNIVTIYDIARGLDSNFIVMEWVDGQSLDKLIPSNGLAVETALEYACQIIDGLTCAHQNGIIHRDIKPQNIMLNKENRIKILDFGIADLLSQPLESEAEIKLVGSQVESPAITRINGVAGTPKYMAPEQANGLSVDQRADIFSFGIVLYEMLTGQMPFNRNNKDDSNQVTDPVVNFAANPAARKVANTKNYTPIKLIRPDLPASLIVMIDKMLAIDVAQRWQTSEELACEIHQLYNELTKRKNWWQQRHWLFKLALVLPMILVLSWSVKETIFPPTTDELVERQLLEATKIALLTFENISGDPLLQLFNDGLVTTLSSDLAKAGREQGEGEIWVIPSSEVRRMKEPSVQKISDKFGVDLILTGSIQHMGTTRLLVLNLLNAKDGRQLKSTELSIDADQLFQGQQNVRQHVLKLLGWHISSELSKEFNAERPQFDGAYKEYVEGKGYLYRYDQANNIANSIDAFQRALKLDPLYENAYEGLAEAYMREFRRTFENAWLDKMATTINELRTINAANTKVDFLLAELKMQTGNYEQAAALYSQSISSDLHNVIAHIGAARAFSKLGNHKQAEVLYKTASEISPNNWRVISATGIHYFRIGEYQKALTQFRKLVTVSPNNDYGFRNMAAVYYALDDIDEAIKFTKQAIQLRPSEQAYSNLGTMLFYVEKYDEATMAFEKSLEIKETNYIIWGNLADSYKLSGSSKSSIAFERAKVLALEAVKRNPKDITAKVHLTYYLANLNLDEQAFGYAENIEQELSGLENFILATAFDQLNETEISLKYLRAALIKSYSIDEILRTPLLVNCRKKLNFKSLLEEYNKK